MILLKKGVTKVKIFFGSKMPREWRAEQTRDI